MDVGPETNSAEAEADRLADNLASGRLDEVASLFHRNGSPAPMIVWSPTDWDLAHTTLRAFASLCGSEPLTVARYEACDLGWVADRLMVLDVENGGESFRYRHYGAEIAETYGRDMTGRSTRDFGGHISLFFTALYRAMLRRGEPALSVHAPPRTVFVSEWRRLILPLRDAQGGVARLVAVNVADNPLRAGLEVVPVPIVVLADDETVLFANSAARALFGDAQFAGGHVAMMDYAGFALRLPAGADMLEDVSAGTMRDGVAMKFRISARRITFRDNPLTVVVARPG